jgi:hypothetical protein
MLKKSKLHLNPKSMSSPSSFFSDVTCSTTTDTSFSSRTTRPKQKNFTLKPLNRQRGFQETFQHQYAPAAQFISSHNYSYTCPAKPVRAFISTAESQYIPASIYAKKMIQNMLNQENATREEYLLMRHCQRTSDVNPSERSHFSSHQQ